MRKTVATRKIWKTSNKIHVSGNCDDICYTRTESKVHVHTCHEGDDNNEVKKKAKRNVNDENYIWKGRRRKLLQTSSILIPILLKKGDAVDVVAVLLVIVADVFMIC